MYTDSFDSLRRFINSGAVVVTVNTRLSRFLRSRYDRIMVLEEKGAWPSPMIVPLGPWIKSLWESSWPDRPLLSDTRSRVLWERIVSSDREVVGRGIISLKGIAQSSYDAYAMMKEYCLTFPEEIYLSGESLALRRWASAYEKRLEEGGFIGPHSLSETVAGLIRQKKIQPPPEIVVAGFDEVTPALRNLLDAISERGTKLRFWPDIPGEGAGQPDSNIEITIRKYADPADEVIKTARRVRKLLEGGSPGMTIGVVIPDLNAYRFVAKREFAAELVPESVLPWKDSPSIINISLGEPLSAEPLVKTALDILSVGEGGADTSIFSSILLSPYTSTSGAQQNSLASVEQGLRREGSLHMTLKGIISRMERTEGVPAEIVSRFSAWRESVGKHRGKAFPRVWAERLSDILRTTGWPSSGPGLNSREYQAMMAWDRVMSEFASLDGVLGEIGRQEAFSCLAGLAGDTIHQPETDDAPVQVLGILEASGLTFDKVLIMGTHKEAFPPPPSPNPFIPPELRRRHGLPHSSPERELAFSKRVLSRILKSGGSVEVSYPERVNDRETGLSPLFSDYINKPAEVVRLSGRRIKDMQSADARHEEYSADGIVPFKEGELDEVSHGTYVLREFSACPFMAFTRYRLHAADIGEPEPGLSPVERGSAIHMALDGLWSRLKGSGGLADALESGDLEGIIDEVAGDAIGGLHTAGMPDEYIGQEKKRIAALLREWIEVELKRGRFEVMSREEKHDLVVGGFPVSARFDRVDETEGGRRIIIDYKTGECGVKDWEGSRPKEPQLMVYSLVGDFNAIAFARVRPGDCRFAGVESEGGILRGASVVNDWNGMMDEWKRTLDELGRSFVSGKADVDPRPSENERDVPCNYCDLATLCRIGNLVEPYE